MSEIDILDQLVDGTLGMEPPPPQSPEKDFYDYLTKDPKLPRMYNAQYWLKMELSVYTRTLLRKGYFVSKPGVNGRVQVSIRELARAFLEHYFNMMYLPRFENESEKKLDMEKFLNLVVEYPPIKQLIENPEILI